jgi:uncharacterized protein (DUF362 family)
MAAAAGLLAGCSRQLPPAPTTEEPAPVPTVTPTDIPVSTPAPTPAQTAVARRPDIIQMWPDVPSKVVQARRAGVWDGEDLSPEALREMLDASVTELTGLDDAREAWAALFAPDERVAIKVNSLGDGSTHIPLVTTVAECLQEARVPPEQITIFDRYTSELEQAGYAINRDGPGVRCYGSDLVYTAGWTITDTAVGLSDILLGCDALINVPILKSWGGEFGISFAMKNHFGTFDKPASFHGNRFQRGVVELNALPPIKERTRLLIGDVLSVGRRGSAVAIGNTILTGFDPVALDAIGLQMASEKMAADGRDPTAMTTNASRWLENAAASGLGTNDLENIDLVEVDLE